MTTLKKGTTVCSLEDLIFPVDLIDNPVKTNSEYAKIVRAQIGEGAEAETVDLNYCSDRYELVKNSEIFPQVENILNENGIAFSVQYSQTNNARFYANYTIEDDRFSHKMKGTNDVIKFIWNFQHSYNGLTKYKGIAGYHRLVCSNGLTIPVKEMDDYNLCIQGKHTSSILHSLQKFNNIIVRMIKDVDVVKKAITEKYEVLADAKVANPSERIEEVLKATKISVVDNKNFNTLNDITNRIKIEADKVGFGYDGKFNDWLIYNGINAYIHDDSRNIAAPEKRRETDSKVLEYMLAY